MKVLLTIYSILWQAMYKVHKNGTKEDLFLLFTCMSRNVLTKFTTKCETTKLGGYLCVVSTKEKALVFSTGPNIFVKAIFQNCKPFQKKERKKIP